MPVQNIAALLSTTAAFSGLPSGIVLRVASLLKVQELAEGTVLAKEGDSGDKLFLIIDGRVGLYKLSQNSLESVHIGRVGRGEIAGELSLLTGYPRAATLIAEETSLVATLSRADFDSLCLEFPEETEHVVGWMRSRLHVYQIRAAIGENPLLRRLSEGVKSEFEAAFRWNEMSSGEILFRQGDVGDALYLIVSGRIQLFQEDENAEAAVTAGLHRPEKILSELGKGDMLGEMALLTGERRSATAYAIRDTQLISLDRASFDRIVAAHPKEMLELFVHQAAGRLRAQNAGKKPASRPPVSIAVLVCSRLAGDFASHLAKCLSAFGPTSHLNSAKIGMLFSDSPLSADAAESRLLSWLNDQEANYEHVVYEADAIDSPWTFRSLRQADVLFYVTDANEDPAAIATRLQPFTERAGHIQPNLVLYHSDHSLMPTNTKLWLSTIKVGRHWHIRTGVIDDIARIARSLTGRSVGITLGGGFAFGLAHIGVIQALQELGVPIDHVGGTSMGAVISMACAFRFSRDRMLQLLEEGCIAALKGDYTFPIVSLLSGRKLAHSIGRHVGDLDIEDLWLPYFAISASLVHARMVVHTRGNALRTLLASCRAPVIFPPLGWNNDVLVDGGLVNNVPCDVMREQIGHGTVIAVDVSPEIDFSGIEQFDMHLSGWRVAGRKANPFSRRPKPATIAGIIARLVRLGGVAHVSQIRSSADLYLMPPLERFTFRDFHRGEEMSRLAYNYTLTEVGQWIARHGRTWAGEATGT